MNGLKEKIKSDRIPFIDWLRVFATFMMFIYHGSRLFGYQIYYVNNYPPDIIMTIFVTFMRGWITPLFCVISGMSIYLSLKNRNSKAFFQSRVKRFYIPYFFGLLFIIPIVLYYSNLYYGYFEGNFLDFLLNYYFIEVNWFSGGFFILRGAHLWYLIWAFIFSLVILFLYRFIFKKIMKNTLNKILKYFKFPGVIFLLFIPLVISEIICPYIPNLYFLASNNWQILTYLVFFILGFIFVSNKKNIIIIKKNAIPALIIGIICSIINGFRDFITFNYNLLQTVYSLNGLCWIIVILGLGFKYLNYKSKKITFLNEIVPPFYIFHVPVLVFTGFYIVQLDLAVIFEYLILISSSFLIIMGFCLIIRKINFLRFVFGMKKQDKSFLKNNFVIN